MFFKKKSIFQNAKTMNDVLFLVQKEVCQSYYIVPTEISHNITSDNFIYLPHGFGNEKQKIDSVVLNMISEKNADNYDCQMIYKKKSLIPSKLIISALKENNIVYSEELLIWE